MTFKHSITSTSRPINMISGLILVLSVIACAPESEPRVSIPSETTQVLPLEDITVEQAIQLMESDSVIILDVRTQDEVNQGFIEGAMHIDFYSDDFKEQIAALDTSKTYVVYCRSGNRSGKASTMMTQDLNFKHVKNLLGGYQAWSKQ